MAKIYTRFQTKMAQKPYPLGQHKPKYSLYRGIPPSPQAKICQMHSIQSCLQLLWSPCVIRFYTGLDCEQSLFCSKIRGEKVAEHESRGSGESASSARGGRRARLPPRALLATSPLACDSIVLGIFFPADFRAKERLLAV